jgi:hypothetical protein
MRGIAPPQVGEHRPMDDSRKNPAGAIAHVTPPECRCGAGWSEPFAD